MTEDSSRPGIVVLGAPRSGTTLMRRILDAHPAIACPGETFLLRSVARFIEGDTVSDGIDYGVLGGLASAGLGRDDLLGRLRVFATTIFEEIAAAAGKDRWANKTAVDSFYIDGIEQVFGGHVKFVGIVRHGLDTAGSMQDLCDANGAYIEELHRYIVRHPVPLEAFVHAWADTTRAILDLAERRPDDTIVLKYEDLVERPDEVLAELFGFLGERWQEDLIDRVFGAVRAQGLGDWKTYATTRIHDSSVGRHEAMTDAMRSRLAVIANPVLERAGYDALPIEAPPDPDDALRRYEMELTLKAAQAGQASDD